MTPRKFFVGRAIGFAVVIVLALGIFAYNKYLTPTEDKVNVEPPIFTWKYEKDDSLNMDGLSQTNVYLEASYSGKVTSKLIATVPGGCNDLPEKEADSVANSSVAQCYAAGYGDRYKVTKGELSYLVMHKVFEEGSPDYNPPVQQYKVVAEFPF